jgi:RNA polymerase sigma factor (sigma-70 family)
MEPGAEDLAQQCRAAVESLRTRHQWQLLSLDEFASRTQAMITQQPTGDPRRAAVTVYSAALHVACSGAEGEERREAGFGELWRYLCTVAHRRYPDVGQDAVQAALLHICATIGRCHTPAAFLAFALQALMNAVRSARRQARHEVGSVDELDERAPQLAVSGPELDAQLESADCRRAITGFAAEFRRRHPRAVQQFEALWLKYVDGLDDEAISERLGVSVKAVYLLRTRARKRLRSEPAWRSLAEQMGFGSVAPVPVGIE